MSPPLTRRQLLAGAGAATAGALAGCTDRLRRGGGDGLQQISLSIRLPPPEDDPPAAMIASQLEENLRTAGVDAVREPMERSELKREVLVEREYDVFVLRYPEPIAADGLRPLLHSRFVSEQGWQNPFGFSDPSVDEYLEEQLSKSGETRREVLTELFEYLVDAAPYTAIAFPDHLGAASSDLDRSTPPRRPADFVALLAERSDDGPLRIGTFDLPATDRLNPIAVDGTNAETILDLLYDPLARRTDGGVVPWLAETVSWEEPATSGGSLVATVELRDGLTWHDGESLTASDVAFTYSFVGDTSLGEAEGNVPALRFRGRQSIVDDVDAAGSRRLEFVFDSSTREVAERALTIPILPEHVWEPRAELVGELWTEALATDNDEPVGSGLFSFADATDDGIELEPFDEHVLRTAGVPGLDDQLDAASREGMEFQLSPSPGAAIEALLEGDVELIADPMTPDALEPAREDPDVSILNGRAASVYVVGYNTQHAELGNPNFRKVVSHLVDREYVVDEFFDGYAHPVESPSTLVGVRDPTYDDAGGSIPSFPGSDGEVDEDRVRSRFEDAGYRYENGNLMS